MLAAALVAALLAVVLRVPLLFDDPWAPGYDGWYYVLQARSILDGQALFADSSLVHPLLAAIGWLVGDVVVGNKLATCLFAAIGAGGAAVGAARWTGRASAGWVAGLWWAAAPGHVVLSSEFLKNEAGIAVLGLLLAVLPGCERRVGLWVSALVFATLGLLVHKLTGVFGLVLVVGYGGMRLQDGRLPRWVWLAGLGIAAASGLALGVLRPEDLERFAGGQAEGSRLGLIATSVRIPLGLRASLLLTHLAPVALAALLLGRGGAPLRALGVPLVLVALATTALGLPFGFDLTSWRLLILGFIPGSFLMAALVARAPDARIPKWAWAVLPATLALAHLPWTVPHVARAEPDYAAWNEVLPVIQARVPATDRVVAHRGVCGFVWAVGDRICENFDPQGSADGWWRITYAVGRDDLAPYSPVEPVPLVLGYTLVPESAWRRFRAEHDRSHPYVRHPLNPFRERPAYVYGPGRGTPEPGESDE